jgi:hypothetical protein
MEIICSSHLLLSCKLHTCAPPGRKKEEIEEAGNLAASAGSEMAGKHWVDGN